MGEGKGRMILENGIETCILPCVKQMTSPSLMHEAGHSKLVLWDNPEGWGFRMEGHMHPVVDSCQFIAKTTTIL